MSQVTGVFRKSGLVCTTEWTQLISEPQNCYKWLVSSNMQSNNSFTKEHNLCFNKTYCFRKCVKTKWCWDIDIEILMSWSIHTVRTYLLDCNIHVMAQQRRKTMTLWQLSLEMTGDIWDSKWKYSMFLKSFSHAQYNYV